VAHGKRWKGLGGVGEKLTGRLETWLSGWEQSRFLSAYNRFRRRFSGPPVPGLPESSHLDPFVFMSVGIHLFILLLIYLLAARTLSLAERPPHQRPDPRDQGPSAGPRAQAETAPPSKETDSAEETAPEAQTQIRSTTQANSTKASGKAEVCSQDPSQGRNGQTARPQTTS